MPRTTPNPVLLDEVFGWNGHACRMVRAYRVFMRRDASSLTVRIIVQAGGAMYGADSHAYAEVLSVARTWTELADTPLSMWEDAVPHPAERVARDASRRRGKVTTPEPAMPDYQAVLGGVADRLLDRALLILESAESTRLVTE